MTHGEGITFFELAVHMKPYFHNKYKSNKMTQNDTKMTQISYDEINK